MKLFLILGVEVRDGDVGLDWGEDEVDLEVDKELKDFLGFFEDLVLDFLDVVEDYEHLDVLFEGHEVGLEGLGLLEVEDLL